MRFIPIIFLLILFSCTKEEQEKTSKNEYYEKAWSFLDAQNQSMAFIYFNKSKDLFFQKKDNEGMAKSMINMAIIMGDKGDYFGSQEISFEVNKLLEPKNQKQKEILSSNYNNS